MNPLFAALPGVFLLLVLFAWKCGKGAWLEAGVLALLTTAAVTVAATEVLSLVGMLRPGAMLGLWLLAVAVAGRWLWRAWRHTPLRFDRPGATAWPWLAAFAPAVLVTLLVAVVAVPSTWDSMTYHLSRVEHWLQNGSLRFYPTAIARQLQLAPLAEILILQVRALAGGDQLVNLVQWTAFLGSMVAAASVCARLGGDRLAQATAALFVATMPMAILQASSTQNDLVTACLVLCTVDRAIALHQAGYHRVDAAWLGVAAGAALLTKGTAAIFLAPTAALLLVAALRQFDRQKAIAVMVAMAVTVALNGGHLLRLATAQALDLPQATLVAHNGVWSLPGVLASNLLRNLGSELNAPFEGWNTAVVAAVRGLHDVLHLDASAATTTFEGIPWQMAPHQSLNEDMAGNPWHVALAAVALGWCALQRRRRLWLYGAQLVTLGLLFLALIRWQPWIVRLHLPALTLLAPLAGIAAAALGTRLRWTLIAVSVVGSLPWLLCNQTRPLIPIRGETGPPVLTTPRNVALFQRRVSDLMVPYDQVTSWLVARGARAVALRCGADSWEYPLWWLLRHKSPTPVRLEHDCLPGAAVRDPALAGFAPEFVVSVDVAAPPTLDCNGRQFAVAFAAAPVTVYAPTGERGR